MFAAQKRTTKQSEQPQSLLWAFGVLFLLLCYVSGCSLALGSFLCTDETGNKPVPTGQQFLNSTESPPVKHAFIPPLIGRAAIKAMYMDGSLRVGGGVVLSELPSGLSVECDCLTLGYNKS